MTLQQAFQELWHQLLTVQEDREARTMSDFVLEQLTGWRKTDRILHKDQLLTGRQQELLAQYTAQLLQHRPVQYVLQEAWFAGMKLRVNEKVLIPRPETEELLNWVLEDLKKASSLPTRRVAPVLLDIGTGSGCLAIALKKNLPSAWVQAGEISSEALAIAESNARDQEVYIDFRQLDILDRNSWKDWGMFDHIVSNPPYIPIQEKSGMDLQVTEYEPPMALFVPDRDPLLFYRAIARFGQSHLNPGGKLYVEIHESFGQKVCSLLQEENYRNISLQKDCQGKDRMVRADG